MNWAIASRSGAITLDRSTPTPGAVAPPSNDADTDLWIAAVVGAGGSVSGDASTGRQKLVNDLIIGLKTDAIWALIDRLWLHTSEGSIPATLIDIKALATATAVNSPTPGANGYTFNGTSSYLTQTFIPSGSENFTLNSCHFGAWAVTNPVGCMIGSIDGVKYAELAEGAAFWIIALNDASSYASARNTGFTVATRTASGARAVYTNGSSVYSDATGSSTLILNAAWIGARNYGGTPDQFSTTQIAATCIGGGLDATANTKLYNRLRTFMTGAGVP